MPDIHSRLPQNITGRFFVDDSCVDCDHCRSTAPNFFRRDDDIGQSFVYAQPVSDSEIENCIEAMEGCPTESIGEME